MAEVPYVRQSEHYQSMPDLGRAVLAPVRYEHGPDSQRQVGVPVGGLIERSWNHSKVFPGTGADAYVAPVSPRGLRSYAALLGE